MNEALNVNVLVNTEGLSREEWLKYRKRGIGGSDVAALLGISKWTSAVALWLDKTNQTNEPEEVNEAMRWGQLLEPVIREQFRQITGRPVVEVKAILQHPQYPFMIADIDGLTVDEDGAPAILEVKNVSEYKRSEWSQGVPAYYETQIQHYLLVTGVQKAYVIALFGGNSSAVYTVEADPEVQQMLVQVESDFWSKVQNLIRPEIDGTDESTKLLDSIYRGGVSGRSLCLQRQSSMWMLILKLPLMRTAQRPERTRLQTISRRSWGTMTVQPVTVIRSHGSLSRASVLTVKL